MAGRLLRVCLAEIRITLAYIIYMLFILTNRITYHVSQRLRGVVFCACLRVAFFLLCVLY